MSVSKKVLRKMKKVMGVIGASAVLVPCSSQVSCAWPWDYIKKVMKKVDDFLFSKPSLPSLRNSISYGKINYYYDSANGYLFVSASWCVNVTDECIFRGDEIEELKCWKDDSKIKNLVVGYGVTEIADNAFSGWRNLENVAILDSVTRVGKCAFSDCSNLKEIMFLHSNSSRSIMYSDIKRHLAAKKGQREDFYDDMLDQFVIASWGTGVKPWGTGIKPLRPTATIRVCANTFKNCENLEYLACEYRCNVEFDKQAFNGCGFFELLFAGQDRILIDGNKEFRK